MLIVKHKSIMPEKIAKRYGDAMVIDLTSKAPDPWVRFSPFYPHGGIPVPFSEGCVGQSVEGIWQGLKVFETEDVDTRRFEITTMRGLKRTVRRFGKVLGHRRGVEGDELLGYREARWEIYLPIYLWVLEHCLVDEVAELRRLNTDDRTILILDYEINESVNNLKRPLSHAGLVKKYVEGTWPTQESA